MDRIRYLPEDERELAGLRARGYIRESTADQLDNSGPIEGRKTITDFAERYGILLAEPDGSDIAREGWDGAFYTDKTSGSDPFARPMFRRMLADADAPSMADLELGIPRSRHPAFDVLLVPYRTRFGRAPRLDGIMVERLHAAGVVIYFIDEHLLSSRPGDEISESVHGTLGRAYLTALSTAVHRGYKTLRFDKGAWSGTPPFGYRWETRRAPDPEDPEATIAEKTGQIVPDTRPVERVGFPGEMYTRAWLVAEIGARYASGTYGLRGLADALNAEGYRTLPSRDRKKVVAADMFSASSLRTIIASGAYVGEMSWAKRGKKVGRKKSERKARPTYGATIVVEGHHEALWTPELWRDIRAVAARQSTGGGGPASTCRCADDPHGCRAHFAFRRRIVCVCGSTMYGERRPNGTAYYACPRQRESHSCPQRAIRESDLSEAVTLGLVPLASSMAGDVEAAVTILNRQDAQPEPVDESPIRAEMARVVEMRADGLISREDAVRRTRALEAQLVAARPRGTYSAAAVADARGRAADFLGLWDAATSAERAEIVSAMFDGFRVRPDGTIGASVKPEYEVPIAIGQARMVRMARPEGVGRAVLGVRARSRRAVPVLILDNVAGLVEALRRAA